MTKDEMNSREATQILKGKVIRKVAMNRHKNAGYGGYSAHPVIYFTDGSRLQFFTIEQEDGYGTDFLYTEESI